jgi:hypothetical protein
MHGGFWKQAVIDGFYTQATLVRGIRKDNEMMDGTTLFRKES